MPHSSRGCKVQDQGAILIRYLAKAETPVLWPPHARSWFIGKDSDAGRDWGQEETGTTEDEMAGWHHWLDGRESQWTPGVGDGQGGLACCDSWGRKESDMTELLNWNEQISATIKANSTSSDWQEIVPHKNPELQEGISNIRKGKYVSKHTTPKFSAVTDSRSLILS